MKAVNIIIPMLMLVTTSCYNAVSGNQVNSQSTQNSKTLVINFDTDMYSPIMSSRFGIGLTPSVKENNIKYHWTTDYGYFVDSNIKELSKDFTNNGDKIYWSYNWGTESKFTGKATDFTINLSLDNSSDKAILKCHIDEMGVVKILH